MTKGVRFVPQKSTAEAVAVAKVGAGTWRRLALSLGYKHPDSAAAMLCSVGKQQPGALTAEAESDLRMRLGLDYHRSHTVAISNTQSGVLVLRPGRDGALTIHNVTEEVEVRVVAVRPPRKRKSYYTLRLPDWWREILEPDEARAALGSHIADRLLSNPELAAKCGQAIRRVVDQQSATDSLSDGV